MFSIYFTYADNTNGRFGVVKQHKFTIDNADDALAYAHRVEARANANQHIGLEWMSISHDGINLWSKDYCNLCQRSKHLPITL